MERGLAPEWVASALPILLGVAIALGAIWLGLALLDYLNRRAYNLTVADRTGNGGSKPGFLSVDQEKRDAAIAAGEAFDQKIAQQEAERAAKSAPTASRAASFAGWGAGIFGFLTMITAALGAFGRIEYYDAAARQLTNFERLGQIIETYWIGFLIVAIMIAIQIYQFIVTVKKS